jgi:hypothetical protein
VSRLNKFFGTAFKFGELDGGQPLSCTNNVGLEPTTTIVFIRNKPSLDKGFLKNSSKGLKFGTSCASLLFGHYGLNLMIGCSTKTMAQIQG